MSIRVLIVDDSAFMRHALGRLLGEAPGFEIVGSAANGVEGLQKARELRPDVITLDVEMPILDGLSMLKLLMHEAPTRVVMLSSKTTHNAQVTLDALEYGAIDFVPKPSGSLSIDITRVGDELIAKIQAAASMSEAAFLRHRQTAVMALAARGTQEAPTGGASGPTHSALPEARGPRPCPERPREASAGPRIASRKLVVVASSTGGPGALHVLVSGLPATLGASMIIVQHMPPGFTASLAGRLDQCGKMPCKEAIDDDLLVADRAFVAPGDHHLIASTRGFVQLVRLPPVNGVRPAADVTLQAVAPIYRQRLLAVVLTGMGSDAREGCRAVKLHGGTVFAQDQATSTIYGMPSAVAEAGLTDRILPLPEIAEAISAWAATEAWAGDGESRTAMAS